MTPLCHVRLSQASLPSASPINKISAVVPGTSPGVLWPVLDLPASGKPDEIDRLEQVRRALWFDDYD